MGLLYKVLLTLMLAVIGLRAFSQQVVVMGDESSVTGCDFIIYDDGGASGNYSPLLNQTLTIYPEENQGRVAVTVQSLDVHSNDTLIIYDGNTASGATLAKLNNSNFIQSGSFTYTASTENPTGALTLRFKSSFFVSFFSNHGAGFKLQTSCASDCQSFTIAFDTANCSKLPVLHEDGFLYLDLCPNEESQIAVKCLFDNNNTEGYSQTTSTTMFKWVVSGAEVSGLGQTTLDFPFENSHGYDVSVNAFDVNSCPVLQPISFRVRTSDNPVTAISNIPQLCVNDEFLPSMGASMDSNVVLKDVGSQQTTSLVVSDTVFLPDGISCPPYGTSYRSQVTFTDFAQGASISSPNDLLYVRIKMEHSAIEDLQIKIFCPNGQSSTILPNPNYQTLSASSYYRVNLGSARRPDGGVSCDATINPIGEPWNYVWSNNTALGYQYAPGNGSCFSTQNFHSHYNPHWDNSNYYYFNDTQHSFSVDSTDVANMTQVYKPYQNFSSLIGCPLNGTWFIEVQDMLPEDNGYIVEWELALDPDLLPADWSYEVDVDSVFYENNGLIQDIIKPNQAGVQQYTLHVIDDFGCEFESGFNVVVHDYPNVELGGNKSACQGETVELSPMNINNNYKYEWNTGGSQPKLFVNNPGTYFVTASVEYNGDELCSSIDSTTVDFFSHSYTELSDVTCENSGYEGNDFHITPAQLFGKTQFSDSLLLSNVHGCDSVVRLDLTVLPSYNVDLHKNACVQYEWNGEVFNESGDYQRTFTSSQGCDSTVTLHLSIGYPATSEFSETVCGQYVWDGNTYTQSGDYEKTFNSSHDCDSMVVLHLTVIDTNMSLKSSNPDFCESQETILTVDGNFDNYVWNTGETSMSIDVTESGRYTVVGSNIACEKLLFIDIPFCELNILIPNAITPSAADGLNDALRLPEYIKHQIGDFSIEVYNRFGTLVFRSLDKDFEWDGTVDGKLFPGSAYNYVIRCTNPVGRPYRKTGSIIVL